MHPNVQFESKVIYRLFFHANDFRFSIIMLFNSICCSVMMNCSWIQKKTIQITEKNELFMKKLSRRGGETSSLIQCFIETFVNLLSVVN